MKRLTKSQYELIADEARWFLVDTRQSSADYWKLTQFLHSLARRFAELDDQFEEDRFLKLCGL